jgi:DNA-binding LacI/PurR family transcriptional regulator
VDQSSSLIGETAADLLVECMEAKAPRQPKHMLIPPRLIVRESSRRK